MRDFGRRPSGRHRRRRLAGWVCAAWAATLLGSAQVAYADEYDPQQAAHPFRVVAYMVHPVGVTLDYLIVRPAFWVGSREPFRTFFGRGN